MVHLLFIFENHINIFQFLDFCFSQNVLEIVCIELRAN